jgi:hypothetical protein
MNERIKELAEQANIRFKNENKGVIIKCKV